MLRPEGGGNSNRNTDSKYDTTNNQTKSVIKSEQSDDSNADASRESLHLPPPAHHNLSDTRPGIFPKPGATPSNFRDRMTERENDAEGTGSKTKKRRTQSNVSISSGRHEDRSSSSGRNAESSGYYYGVGKFQQQRNL